MVLQKRGTGFLSCSYLDTKPTNYAINTILFEHDTGNSYVWNGAAWVSFIGYNIQGRAVPSVSVVGASLMTLEGAFAGLTQTAGGTSTHTLDTTEGFFSNYVSAATANVNTGITTPAAVNNITTPNFYPTIRARFKIDSTTASRVWIGFIALPIVVGDAPMASGTAGVLFGFGTADTTFIVKSNDASGAAATTVMTGITKDANWHTVSITLTPTPNAVIVLDDGAGEKTKTLTTAADIPAATQSLGVFCTGQTSTTTAKTFSAKLFEMRAAK
jgi:hypothetical protein